jgi:DNA-binding transcriptional regulator YhcF (GntR family)
VDTLGLHVNRDGEIPLGTQLAWQIQALITNGRLRAGEQLPSVRRLAETAGVNVNTVRSVYERLEGEGFVFTEHGRGTFVAENVPQLDPDAVAARLFAGAGRPPTRDEIKGQIGELEKRLSTHIPPPSGHGGTARPRLLTTDELAAVRDELADRLEQLDAMRDDLVDLLGSIRTAMGEEPEARAPTKAKAARARARPATT